ncbi:hypothetical protein F4824DRAFT_501867 [Ustulina deusta]|nr:hypothetical protein F4824DRAFT_501867 [Ustulina deusta]
MWHLCGMCASHRPVAPQRDEPGEIDRSRGMDGRLSRAVTLARGTEDSVQARREAWLACGIANHRAGKQIRDAEGDDAGETGEQDRQAGKQARSSKSLRPSASTNRERGTGNGGAGSGERKRREDEGKETEEWNLPALTMDVMTSAGFGRDSMQVGADSHSRLLPDLKAEPNYQSTQAREMNGQFIQNDLGGCAAGYEARPHRELPEDWLEGRDDRTGS